MRLKRVTHWLLKQSARFKYGLGILDIVDSVTLFSIVRGMILLSDVLLVSIQKEVTFSGVSLLKTARRQASWIPTMAGRLQKHSMA